MKGVDLESQSQRESRPWSTDVAAQVARSQTLVLAEYRGITVEHLNKLRAKRASKGVYLHVLKNTLARRAVEGTPFEVASESMVGPLIYGFSEDAVAAAKVVADFAKTQRQADRQGRCLRRQGAGRRRACRRWPTSRRKEVLLSQLLGLMQSPIARLRPRPRRAGARRRAAAPKPRRQPKQRPRPLEPAANQQLISLN